MEVWILFLFVLNCCIHRVSPTTFESDVTALKQISKGLNANLRWSDEDPCGSKWTGITCNSYNVTKLILNNMNIGGRLLPSVGNLVNLRYLDLSFNPQLSGELPKALGQMQYLEILNLQACGFSGSIPSELGGLKKLRFLGLNMNKLTGSIPPELGGLSSVYWFDLAQNALTGELPVSSGNPQNIGLDNLTEALHFHLNGNKFTGSFPKEICSLPKLIHLLLDNNNFNGPVPNEIGNFSSLTILRLDVNRFSGSIPRTIAQVASLTEIHISNNTFSGTLPDLSTLPNLKLLSASKNDFDPQPVPSFKSTSPLQTIEIDEGNLIGPIPNTFFQLPSLESVSFKKNSINGTVNLVQPTPSLVSVMLDDNNIKRLSIDTGNNQYTLSLSGNPEACKDASLASSCAGKEVSQWKANRTCAGTCSKNKVMDQNTCFCAYPVTLSFTFNAPSFSGINTTRIDILRSAFVQALQLSSIDQVWVESTNFTSDNRLHARVYIFPPKGEESLSSQTASYIITQVSTHQIKGLDYYGPYSLVVGTIGVSGTSKGISTGTIVGIIAGVVIGILAIAAVSIYAFKQKRRADKATVSSNPFASWGSHGRDSGSAPQLKGARFFTFTDLKKATNNFNNEIGFGGYGKVYKGTLVTGEEVAIKRAQGGSLQGANEFKNEIELLSRVHHRNLVGLLGFCYENGEQMLVYEYMSNGTIREHLPDHIEVLTWRKRLEIAVGAAKGIAYLHELANPPIIHRDIKSNNILLDDKFVAKVADFGLSKLAPPTDATKAHISTQVKGTLGYLDPEYYMTHQLTEKSDVYSFGVVLLELVTAKQPIENGKYIVREVRTALEKGGIVHLLPMLDPYLKDYPREDLDTYIDIALNCVNENAKERLAMSEVVKELEILLSHISSSGFLRESSGNRTPLRYNEPGYIAKAQDPSFQYSGGFPHEVEPK